VSAVSGWVEQQFGVSTEKQGAMLKEQLKKTYGFCWFDAWRNRGFH
jgi:hypothetical protein